MRCCNTARNRQSKPGAAGLPLARSFEPVERLEHPLQFGLRNSGPVIAHQDQQALSIIVNRNVRAQAVLDCVFQQIGQAALECLRPAHIGFQRGTVDADLSAGFGHAYRVFPRDPKIGASNFDIGNAIDLAVADGCDLLNLSLGGGPMDAVTDEAIKAARAAGTVCVIAAGNDAGPVANPGRHPLAVCVSAMGFEGAWPKGAMQDDDVTRPFGKARSYIAAFSNTGPEIDLTGTGCGIISTYPMDRFAVMDGTSMACPCVTGAIARRLARDAALLGEKRDAARADRILQLAFDQTRDLGFPASLQGAGLRV